jgi:2-keto-4-pentenoate hydratase/2-oxohepta-3-ene-1,7-dioic acid hydratase in catechol pathway
MRLATFSTDELDGPRAGSVDGERVRCFEEGVTVDRILASGSLPEPTSLEFGLEDVTLHAPYRPRVIFGVGLNYVLHASEGGAEVPSAPLVFMKGPASSAGPAGPVTRPAGIRELDYEGELAVVLGAGGAVAGYAIADDVSARDIREQQLTCHKGGDGFCPWGPWVTTVEEISDPYALGIRTWVDGELRQDGNTGEMLFRVPDIVAAITRTIAVEPGDLLITGTPAGVGIGFDPPRFLADGQRVRIAIDGLGEIEHEVVPA